MVDDIVVAENQFTKEEKEALAIFREKKNGAITPPLASGIAVKMYELFALGHTCEEIFAANERKFPLGAIVDARLRHKWDKRRDEYLDRIYSEANENVKQRQTEGALFLGDVMAVTHKELTPKFHRFLQTGDVKDLPDSFRVDSISKYVKIVEALMHITGQDRGGGHGPSLQVNVKGDVTMESSKKTLTSNDAFETLKQLERLDAEDDKKDD